jgi:hypothetical protein
MRELSALLHTLKRVSYSGITLASQAKEEGSIPFTRSNFHTQNNTHDLAMRRSAL